MKIPLVPKIEYTTNTTTIGGSLFKPTPNCYWLIPTTENAPFGGKPPAIIFEEKMYKKCTTENIFWEVNSISCGG